MKVTLKNTPRNTLKQNPHAKRTNTPQFDEPAALVPHMAPSKPLMGRQKEIFVGIVHSFPPEFFAEADRFLLESFCRMVHLQETAAERLEEAGAFSPETDLAGLRKSPVELFMRSALAIANMSQRLRTNPSSRATVKQSGQKANDEKANDDSGTFLSGLHDEFPN